MSSPALSVITRAGRAALDLLYPRACALCARSGAFVCDDCLAGLTLASPPRCNGCWRPVRLGVPCYHCDERPLAVEAVRSAFEYGNDVRTLVHKLKFKNFSALAEDLAQPMAELASSDRELEADVLVPVPLTASHLRERGYNQAALLAKQVSAATGLPLVEPLRRVRHSDAPQSRTAGAGDRWQNVAGAFALRRPRSEADVEGRTVLLVDDVVTTGATLDACARVLLEAGAARVNGLTFARQD